MKTLSLKVNEKTVLEVEGTGQKLFLLNFDGKVVILPGILLEDLKIKRGSISLRIEKGMSVRQAFKDIIKKSKAQKTQSLILELKEN